MSYELPPPDELLLPRDASPMEHVPSEQWWCHYCPVDDYLGPVHWVPLMDGSQYGRCGTCGQKYQTVEALGETR